MADRGKEKEKISSDFPPYDGKSDKELFRLYHEDKSNIKLRNELVKRNLYIAEILAKKYVNKGIEYEDILQVASLGILYAVERYDISKGFEFSSFATPTVIGEIKKYFRDKGWSIRVPRKIQELSKKVNQARTALQNQNGYTPKAAEIAEYIGITEEEVLEVMEASQAYKLKSLDITYENTGDDKDTALMDILGKDDRSFADIENRDFVKKALSKLQPVEKRIIIERYFNQKTQMRIAKEMNISQMTVSSMEKKILEKLKQEYDKSVN